MLAILLHPTWFQEGDVPEACSRGGSTFCNLVYIYRFLLISIGI